MNVSSRSCSTIPDIQRILQKDFDSITSWLPKNQLIINTKKGKTEMMLFGKHQRLWRQNDSLTITHNGTSINLAESYKYLGITLTKALNMTNHLEDTIKKASSRICLLRRARHLMDVDTAHLVYQSMILPLFTYRSFCLYLRKV